MSPNEYQELAEFVAAAFDRQREETRSTLESFRRDMAEETRRIAEVTVEALRGEIRIVAEGVADNGRKIEANRIAIEDNGRKIEANRIAIGENGRRIDSLAVRFDRVELRIGEHEARLTRLEQGP